MEASLRFPNCQEVVERARTTTVTLLLQMKDTVRLPRKAMVHPLTKAMVLLLTKAMVLLLTKAMVLLLTKAMVLPRKKATEPQHLLQPAMAASRSKS